ncbi:MAG: PQQ-binding-like beta-propeller repeat protein [Phycisphaerae bacterium]|nr:PQQ-binding-like beta-propeller repeat protein [Phycisphaerae bacterium]
MSQTGSRSALWPCVLASAIVTAAALAADQPQWGERFSRNMISHEKNLPDTFDLKTGKNVKWSAALGTETNSSPVVASGRVFIGTNNAKPRDPQHQGDCGVVLCLDERDGRLVWQLVVPKKGPNPFMDWPNTGMVSPVTVEDRRLYLVSNRNEVMCLDLDGMTNGNDGPYKDEGQHMAAPDAPPAPVNPTDADILWLYDMQKLGIHSHDAAHASVLVYGDCLYLCTSNGVADDHLSIPSPDAPSLVVFNKNTGKLVARDNEQMAPRTIHNTWSSPSLGEVDGRPLIFFAGGDGLVYAFEPLPSPPPDDSVQNLKRVWSFDCDPAAPKEDIFKYQDNRTESPSNITGMPVFHRNRVYVEAGGDYWHGKPQTWLKCIDATGTGNITRSGKLWSYPLNRFCMSTPSVMGDLVFIGDCGREVHCVDAHTGRPYWTHRVRGEIWASLLVADGKVYAASRSGEFSILAAEREKKVIRTINLGGPIHATPIAANGVLYVATMTRLYAIQQPPNP